MTASAATIQHSIGTSTRAIRQERQINKGHPKEKWSEITTAHEFFSIFFFFLFFLGLHLWHMEVPRLGVKSELQLPAYTTATATRGPSRVCNLYHSSRQCQILNPLGESRDRTRILMDTSWAPYRWVTMGTSINYFFMTGIWEKYLWRAVFF